MLLKIWVTRDSTALTINVGSWQAVDSGNIEEFKPALSTDSTFDTAKARQIDEIPLVANVPGRDENPKPESIDFYLIHGDYLVITGTGAQAAIKVIVQAGEEV